MTIKDDLHSLIDQLGEDDVLETLAYLRARTEQPSRPGQAFIDECQHAVDEALDRTAVRLPHQAVSAWLKSWGTPSEAAYARELAALEDRLRKDAEDAAAS
jgi:hypothetical protein